MVNTRADRPVFLNVTALMLVALLAIVPGAKGQGWQYLFGGPKEDIAEAIVKTRDGGYLLAGYSESFGSDNDLDIYLVRTDVDGKLLWQQVYDEGFIEHAYDLIETDDGGFLIVGDINTLGTQPNVYLLKVNADGKALWSYQYGDSETLQKGEKVVKAADGGYMIVGSTRATSNGESDILLIKVSDTGEEMWEKTFGGSKYDEGRSIVQFENGYVFVGVSDNEAPNTFDKDIVIYRVDAQGNKIWDKRISTSETEEANDVIVTHDGNIVVAGFRNDNSDAYVVKLDGNKNIMWDRSVDGGNGGGDAAYSIIELQDGSLVLTGYTEVDNQNLDVLLSKLNADGSVNWVTNLGEKKRTDYGVDLVQADDGGFVIAGYTALVLAFINDALIIKTDEKGNTITNFISGEVFHDMDGACDLDPEDKPLKDWLVKVTGGNKTYFGTTDENGRYRILVDTGRYNVQVLPVTDYWESCVAGGYNINLTNFYDTTSLNFPVFASQACPYLEVDISTPFLAVCSDVEYTVTYCNLGTSTASNAYVEVMLDDKLTYVSSSIPFISQKGNEFTFDLGDLETSQCGSFTIQTKMACEGIAMGQSALVSAHIYPDTVCLEPGPDWDGSSVVVSGQCQVDTVAFKLRNAGRSAMSRALKYYIVQDDVILRQSPFQLGAGEEESVSIKSNGATYRIIAEQSEDHPGRSYPTVAVEGCAEDGQPTTTGYVTQFPEDDQDNFIDIDVQEVIGFTENVEMRGYPKGYQDSLIAANTEITYKIFFKNTGTDTVTRVVIRDTLPENLDITSVIPGASSHPYSFEIYGGGVLKITFDSLNLVPDGGANETSNWGFVNFRIAQKPNNSTGTAITNRAAIYFDYDAPVQTNTVRHIVGKFPDFLVTAVSGPIFVPGVKIKVGPNPFNESTTFTIEGKTFNEVTFSIFDLMGRRIYATKFVGNHFNYYRNQHLPAGIYIYKLESEGQLINSGKLMVR